MTGIDDLSSWVNRAEEDFLLAKSSLRRKQPLVYGTTFHSQQCAEKYLKALLTLREASFPRSHDLAALGIICLKAGFILPVTEEDLEKLSAYAVEVRYPGLQLTVEESRDAFRIAKIIRTFARKFLSS